MSHGFTLVVTDDTTCPGVEISRLGGDKRATVGGYLHSIPAVRNWIANMTSSNAETVYVLTDEDPLPEHLKSRCLTFTADEAVLRRYAAIRATA